MTAALKLVDDDPRDRRAIFENARWQPMSWHPIYEQIVALSAAGKTNLELADMFDYTPQHISNILCTLEAKRIFKRIGENMRKGTLESLPQRLEKLTDAAVEVAEEVLIHRREELMADSPFKLMDRSLSYLRGVGKLAGDAPTAIQNNAIFISNSHQKQLVSGLDNLKKVWELHGGPSKEVSTALTNAETEVEVLEEVAK